MKKPHWKVLFAGLLFIASLSAHSQQLPKSGILTEVQVPASSIANNLLGDKDSQPAIVYLPAGYENGSTRYPVLYLLHGFSLAPILKDWAMVMKESMDSFVAANPTKAFIVVIPNAFSRVDGSFYLNSQVGGNWENFISEELVGFVDLKFRTIAERGSRAVAGHSMGGFGALRMLLLHADVFSVGYAASPCCLDFVGDFTSSNLEWSKALRLDSLEDIHAASERGEFWPVAFAAFAIAASPNPRKRLKAEYPYRLIDDKIVADPLVQERWRHVMPSNMLEEHMNSLMRATAVGIDYGFEDQFTHIRLTVPKFSSRLMQASIPVQAAGYHGDHNDKVPARVRSVIIPFMAEHLSFESEHR